MIEDTEKLSLVTPTTGSENSTTEIIKIKPGSSWSSRDLAEIWHYREVIYFLAWRDIKVRYKQTLLGVLWVVMQPLLTTLIFSLFFSRFGELSNGEIPYMLFALSGLTAWNFVSTAIINASNSLVNHTQLVTKVYFPRPIIPLSAILASLVDLLLNLVILALTMWFYQVNLSWKLILIPFFIILFALLAFGIGALLAALNVRYRDVKQILPFAIQLWMFVSPVLFPITLLSPRLQLVFSFNPLTIILGQFRAALFDQPLNVESIGLSFAVVTFILIVALYIFRRMEESLTDFI